MLHETRLSTPLGKRTQHVDKLYLPHIFHPFLIYYLSFFSFFFFTVGLVNALPFIGFGFLDNFTMIIAVSGEGLEVGISANYEIVFNGIHTQSER